ncbi:hypothetical protein M9458_005228, partial [Cirrhinus mrigala]
VFSCHAACSHSSRHSNCSRPCAAAPSPSCHCGHHGPHLRDQHSIHITTELGHHCA